MKIENISKSRSMLMGFSMLLIMIFHTTIKYPRVLDLIKNFGDFGVNIFFFISGFSMYFAWKKRPNVKFFYEKRISRIAFTYLPIAVMWCLLSVAMHECNVLEAICKILTIQFWIDGNLLHWFVSGIIICYLITPWWIMLNEKSNIVCLITSLITCMILFVCPFWGRLTHISCFLQRFPVYIFGLYFGKAYVMKRELKNFEKLSIYILGVISIVVFAAIKFDTLNYKWKYLVYLLMTIPVTLILSEMFVKLFGNKKNTLLGVCGLITLEFYLFQEKILKVLGIFCNKLNITFDSKLIVINIIVIGLTFIVSYLYHRLVDAVVKKINIL